VILICLATLKQFVAFAVGRNMNDALEIAAIGYLLIGLLLGTVGLGGKEISDEVLQKHLKDHGSPQGERH